MPSQRDTSNARMVLNRNGAGTALQSRGVVMDEPEQQKDTYNAVRRVRTIMLGIYSVAVGCVVILSLQSLDGSQLHGWKTWWTFSTTTMMDTYQRLDVPDSEDARRAATALCRCGGSVTLAIDYIGSGIEQHNVPDEVEHSLFLPLERGRRMNGMVNVCRKNLMATYVHHNVDRVEALLTKSERGHTCLAMDGAYQVGWQVHDATLEYPADNNTRGMLMHVMLVDVSTLLHEKLGFPMLGVLSGTDAIAIVDPKDPESLTGLVHEIDAWLYGEGLVDSLRGGPESIVNACQIDARMNLKRVFNVLGHARHARISPALESILNDMVHTEDHFDVDMKGNISIESSFAHARRVYSVLHSPDFGIEPRMPAMHVIALLMPFGLPLLFALMQSIKFLRSSRSKMLQPASPQSQKKAKEM